MRFMNLSKWAGQGYQDEAGGEDKGGQGGGDDDDKGQTLSAEEIAEFTKLKADAADREKGKNDRSLYEKMKQEETDRQNKAKGDQDMRGMVEFDLTFDKLLTDNKQYFTVTAEKVREVAKGLTGQDLNNTLKVTAIKSFFDNEDNLEALSQSEKDYIKAKVIGQHDSFVDTAEAWRIMTNGLHVLDRMSQQDQFRKGKQGENSEMPNFDKYMEKAKARVKSKDAA
jgi:hypothetical protein